MVNRELLELVKFAAPEAVVTVRPSSFLQIGVATSGTALLTRQVSKMRRARPLLQPCALAAALGILIAIGAVSSFTARGNVLRRHARHFAAQLAFPDHLPGSGLLYRSSRGARDAEL